MSVGPEILANAPPASRNVSVRDVARAAGVSAPTVSKVLNNRMGLTKVSAATRTKILDAARALHYVPDVNARRLFSRKTGIIGMIAPYLPEGLFADAHLMDILNGAEKAIAANGYRMLIVGKDEEFVREKKYLDLFRGRQVDATFIWGALRTDNFYHALVEYGYPHVYVTTRPDCLADESLFFRADYAQAAYEVARHLLEKGYRRIAWSERGRDDTSLYDEVNRGLDRALDEARLSREETILPVACDFEYEDGVRLARRLMAEGMPADAVLLVSRRPARGCLDYFREHGVRSPEDCALACCDSTSVKEPAMQQITRCYVDDLALGRLAAGRLLDLLGDGTREPDAVSPSPVVFRSGDTT